jgi:hypothetical protein
MNGKPTGLVIPPTSIQLFAYQQLAANTISYDRSVFNHYPVFMLYKKFLICALCCLLSVAGFSQSERLRDYNQIGWYVYEGDHKLKEGWELHTEYQWRRVYLIQTWQQSLTRLGITYQLISQITIATGYTFLITFPYGDYPIAETGLPYPEHRLHQDLQLSDTVRSAMLKHRFRLEQRWIGQLMRNTGRQISGWDYQNRMRYQLTAILPLQGSTLDNYEWYFNFFDEVFIGFGANVGNNVFNQNRLSGGIDYQFKKSFKTELNYLYQITQHAESAPFTDQRVFEYNHGIRLGITYNIDFTK